MNIIRDFRYSIKKEDSFDSLRLTNYFLNRPEELHRLGTCQIALKTMEFVVRFFLDMVSSPFRAIYAGIIKPGIKAAQTLHERIGYNPLNDDDFTLIASGATPPKVPVRRHQPTAKPKSELTLPQPASIPEPTPAPAPTPPSSPVNKPITNEEDEMLNPSLARFLSPNTQSNETHLTFDQNKTLNPNLWRFLPENSEKEKL
ncbi:MAG: hypothetical protein Q8L98_01900 [Chlamydiales bacterium]|nr:hypothetical protein [Chlamydiales bacterium]